MEKIVNRDRYLEREMSLIRSVAQHM
jgi:hypothetical protein